MIDPFRGEDRLLTLRKDIRLPGKVLEAQAGEDLSSLRQVELLDRKRSGPPSRPDEAEGREHAWLAVDGIAAGMRNTG
ncbi:MAG TPA: phosphoenolpyruvate carboxylase [Vicinamibacteria bacterium]